MHIDSLAILAPCFAFVIRHFITSTDDQMIARRRAVGALIGEDSFGEARRKPEAQVCPAIRDATRPAT